MISAESSEERLLRLVRNHDQSYVKANGPSPLPEAPPLKQFSVREQQTPVIRWEWALLIPLGVGLAVGPSMIYRYQKSVAAVKGAAQVAAKDTEPAAVVPEGVLTAAVEPVSVENPAVVRQAVTTAIVPAAERARPDAFLDLSAPPITARGEDTDIYRQFRILGLVIGADSNAILEDRRTQQVYTVHVGSRIGEALVKDIRPDRILFEVGNDIFELAQ